MLQLSYLSIEYFGPIDTDDAQYLGDLLAYAPFRVIGEQLIGHCPDGLWGALGKLGSSPLPAGLYQKLVTALTSPRKQKVLFHAETITADMVEVLDLLPEPCISVQLINAIQTIEDAQKLAYCIEAISTFVPSYEFNRVWISASRIGSAKHITQWFRQWLEEAPLACPPWSGSRLLCPINTAHHLLRAARSFENCLALYLIPAIGGEFAFYVWSGHEPAVIGVRRDPFFGWAISAMEGKPHRRKLSPTTRAEILEEFQKAQFHVGPSIEAGDILEFEFGFE